MHAESNNPSRTVRELGGEIWAEMIIHISDQIFGTAAREQVLDLVMGVLARHIGEQIENDEDFPVEPLPRTFES